MWNIITLYIGGKISALAAQAFGTYRKSHADYPPSDPPHTNKPQAFGTYRKSHADYPPPPTQHTHKKTKLLPPATKFGQGYIFTGVCDSVHRGVSNFSGGLQFFGGSPIFRGSPNFFFFFFLFFPIFFPQNFFWDAPTPPETVNARAVRILLECILVCVCDGWGMCGAMNRKPLWLAV